MDFVVLHELQILAAKLRVFYIIKYVILLILIELLSYLLLNYC